MTTRECDMHELRNAVTRAFAERVEAITTHPGEDELVRYYAHELPAADEQGLQEHLVLCRSCTDRVLELHRIVQEDRSVRAPFRSWIGATRRGLRALSSIAIALGERVHVAWIAPALAGVVAVLLGARALLSLDALEPGVGGTLSGYVLEVRGDQMRGGGGGDGLEELFRFAPGSVLQIVVHPQQPVAGLVEVEAFVKHAGTVQTWSVPIRVWEGGAARIMGMVGTDLELPPGDSDLYVALGRPGRLPPAVELRRHLARSAEAVGDDWVAWRVRVRAAAEAL